MIRTFGVASAFLLTVMAVCGSAAEPAPVKVTDVTLRDGGILVGQLVTATGAPVKDSQVRLEYQGKTVVALKTNDKGQFGARGLRAGVYQVSTTKSTRPLRVWENGSQPPTAKTMVMLVEDPAIVRAQGGMPLDFTGNGNLRDEALGFTGIGLGAAGLAVALSDDDNPPPPAPMTP
ncbi:hypothetical protein Pla8534_10260 [Lignipirellula cremea]|uniref:Nickel uptake substrate-specific transmembrane region n=2 Tax=Lignipirellula cremea TaxID=2528010 RepID=A0A518DN29_9BACT|nr:hypothetical protein Pla8534_10260 [Lignipirellula cremea]